MTLFMKRMSLAFILHFVLLSVAKGACTSPSAGEGRIDYFTSDSTLKYCNGTSWVSMAAGGLTRVASVGAGPSHDATSPIVATVRGNYAFITNSSETKLSVYDITDLRSPSAVTSLIDTRLASCQAAASVGTTVFVACSSRVLSVDISDPLVPVISGDLTHASQLTGIAGMSISGSVLYAAIPSRLTTIDISNPSAMSILGSVSSSTHLPGAADIVVSGGFAFVAGNGRVGVVDVTNPSSPVAVTSLAHSSFNGSKGIGISPSGEHVYVVAQTASAFSVVNVSNPSAPVRVGGIVSGSWDDFDGATDLIVEGSLVIVTTDPGNNGGSFLRHVDVSVPATPRVVSSTRVSGPSGAIYGIDMITKDGDRAVAINRSQRIIHTFDVSPKPFLHSPPVASFFDGSPFSISDLAITGNTLVAISGQHELFTFDVSNPASMQSRGATIKNEQYNIYSKDVAAADGFAYMNAINFSEIHIFDVNDPSNPRRVSTFYDSALSQTNGMKVVGNYLYALGNSGFVIVDVTNKAAPVRAGRLTSVTSGEKSLDVVGDYAYIPGPSARELVVVNITNKASPTIAGRVSSTTQLSGANDVAVIGDYAYVTAPGNSALTVVDISNKTSPVIVGSVPAVANFTKLEAYNGFLYASLSGGTMRIYDTTNPLAPSLVRSIGSTESATPVFSGNTVFNTGGSGVYSVNITTPASAAIISSASYQGRLTGASGLAAEGNYAYVASSSLGILSIYDISNKSNIVRVNTVTDATRYRARDMVASGGYLYMAGASTFTILNLSNPTAPTLSAYLNNATNFATSRRIRLEGNTAFVLAAGRLTAVNITSKTSPVVLGTVTHASFNDPRDLFISGGRAYIAQYGSDSLTIVNISNPSSMSVLGTYANSTTMDMPRTVVVKGDYAYVGTESSGYGAVLNVSNPASPVLVGTLGLSYTSALVVVGENLVAQGGSPGALHLLSLANPESPTFSIEDLPHDVRSWSPRMSLFGDLLMIGFQDSGSIEFWDVSLERAALGEEAYVVTSGPFLGAYGVAKSGSTAFVVNSDGNSLTSVDVTDPNNPIILQTKHSLRSETLRDIQISGNYAYIYDSSRGGLLVADISNPSDIRFVASMGYSSWMTSGTNMRISGTTAFVAASGRLTSINITNPIAPSQIMSLSNTALQNPTGFAVGGGYAYVCSSTRNSFSIVNVTNPAAMSFVSEVVDATRLGGCADARISGTLLFVISSSSRVLSIYDISNPTSPLLVGSVANSSALTGALQLYIDAGKAYVVSSYQISTFDVSNPSTPALSNQLYSFSDVGFIYRLAVDGGQIYSSTGSSQRFNVFRETSAPALGACTSPGAVDYRTTENVMAFCNGSTWKAMGDVGTGGVGCNTPTASPGSLKYDSSIKKFRYCDGAVWRSVP